MAFVFDNFTDAFIDVCQNISERGRNVEARGLRSREIIGLSIRVSNPRTRIITTDVRKTVLSFAIGEWLWSIQDRNDLSMIEYYAPSYCNYSDDNKTLYGAYGPKVKRGLQNVISKLKSDRFSRQAFFPIFHFDDTTINSKDIPCSIGLQFFIRDNKLILNVFMRSNDIFKGFIYDVFKFTMIQEYLASILNVELGEYVHSVGSMHYYIENEEAISKITDFKSSKNSILMNSMPNDDIDFQLNELILVEERIRQKLDYDLSNLNDYFKDLAQHLIWYSEGRVL